LIHKNSLRIAVTDALELINQGSTFVIFDVRSDESQRKNGWKISPSQRLDFNAFENSFAAISNSSYIFFYCA